jgi:hypothetical protein
MICRLPAIDLTYAPRDPIDYHWSARIKDICEGAGSTPEDAVADVLDTFSALWAHYACLSDSCLAPDAIALKRQLLALIASEATR